MIWELLFCYWSLIEKRNAQPVLFSLLYSIYMRDLDTLDDTPC